MAVSGAALLVGTLDGIESGQIRAVPQPDEGVSFAPKINPDDARVDWGLPAVAIDRLIRACTPDPGAWTTVAGARLKLGPVEPLPPGAAPAPAPPPGAAPAPAPPPGAAPAPAPPPGAAPVLAPGELLVTRHAVLAGTATEPVRLGEVQPPGKRPMAAADWARGLHQASHKLG